jgi:hypothetical protein
MRNRLSLLTYSSQLDNFCMIRYDIIITFTSILVFLSAIFAEESLQPWVA